MHKSVVIGALSGAILFAVAASAADQAAPIPKSPTSPTRRERSTSRRRNRP